MVSQVEQQIHECIDNHRSFVLDAGAGSGKTWTLVETLKYLISGQGNLLKKRNQKIVVITYTNIAKDEIKERTEYNELIIVNTIHDFLWDCIKQFQKELREQFLAYLEEKKSGELEKLQGYTARAVKSREKSEKKIIKYKEAIENITEHSLKIGYENFPNYRKGKISHDDLIVIGERIFSAHPKIRKIIADAYPMILVDEYQDTQKEIIKILLEYLIEQEKFFVGFFGDKVQQIYDKGIGEIPKDYDIITIKKKENFRSSANVIELLNKLRTDIQQTIPADRKDCGKIAFYYYPNPEMFNASNFISEKLLKNWELQSVEAVKVLYLTHRYIAKENNYEELYSLHAKKNADIITKNSDNRNFSPFTDFLFDMEELIDIYTKGKIQQFLKKVHFQINSFDDKTKLNLAMTNLLEQRKIMTNHEIINYVLEKNIMKKSSSMENYNFEDEDNNEFYNQLMNIEYAQLTRLFQVQEDNTPFSTKHNTKGDEFENVLVIIDDKAWKQNFNFNDFFSKNMENEKRYNRTNNLFYVVCSRAKQNLAVVCLSDLTNQAVSTVQTLFNRNNYFELN